MREVEYLRQIRFDIFFYQLIIDAVDHREEDLTSRYHGSKISGSQQSVMTFALSSDGRKLWVTILFLSAIMHRSHACQIFSFLFCLFFPAIFAGPRFVEIQKFCYHGNVT